LLIARILSPSRLSWLISSASPLLANIYLDALDRELERRGHQFSRYADDCNIYVGIQVAGERVMAFDPGLD